MQNVLFQGITEFNEVYNYQEKKYEWKKLERTKSSHPYSYDEFVCWKSYKIDPSEITGSVYADRMRAWNPEKFDKLKDEIFTNKGDYWNRKDKKEVEIFLQKYLDKPTLRLVCISESCNRASGYPVFCLLFAE